MKINYAAVAFVMLGVILCVAGIVNSPTTGQIISMFLDIAQSLWDSFWKSKIYLQPGCYGLFGLLIVVLAGRFIFSAEKRQRVRETVKQNLEVVQAKVTSVLKKNPQHRPPINDDEAVNMKLENPNLSYRQIYDHLFPPKQDSKEEQKREEYFTKNWRSRVSQKVNEKIKANARKYET